MADAATARIRLAGLLPVLERHPQFASLVRLVRERRRISIADPAKPFVVAALHDALQRPIVLVTARPGHARELWEELCAWAPDQDRVIHFPAPDPLPYERIAEDPENVAQRVRALSSLAAPAARPLVVLSGRATMDLLEPPERFRGASRALRVGDEVSPASLLELWVANGYEPSPLVDGPGQLSRRGGIVDVYPPGGPPCRIEFFGNEIESMRVFHPETQRSGERIGELFVPPARERATPDRRGDDHGAAAPGRGGDAGAASATFFDHLPPDALIILDEPDQILTVARDLEEQVEALRADLQQRGELPIDVPRPYLPWPEVRSRLSASQRDVVELIHDPARETIAFAHAPTYAGRMKEFLHRVTQAGRSGATIVVSQQSGRLEELLSERGSAVSAADRLPDLQDREPPPIALVHGSLAEGWHSEPLGVTVLTDTELFGWRKLRRPLRRARTAAREAFLSDLEPGELVVHIDHGIARFRGLVRMGVGGEERPGDGRRALDSQAVESSAQREFLMLEYDRGDRLYVPIEQADRVSRYVGGVDEHPTPTRLGTQEWSRAKARVRRAVRDIARDLLELYASREVAEGHAFSPDTPWQAELEASFPYIETPDQIRAIAEVKADMELVRPMDRLLVGDVGYGKTEVALRAAFKAVMDGRQVAVLVPTTVLAQQHFTTFQERLGAFPARVEMLSRFRSEKEQRQIIEQLTAGTIDICIGTHRLVQKDVRFKNLGLVIIDEEQRFGVAHKERLKQLRKEVDVLTLTATPIPRTLHMSLAGVRDMSAMETAPEDRLPIRTYVAEYDEGLIREVILREIDRGGQVYFVHNRVHSIELVTGRLRRLVPEARFCIGHGQMPEEQLERVMLEFAGGEADVLVCTTIIESGLDIPNVNTIIVNNAHRFGLAQLYQLRGRVGRGSVRAYGYFLYARDTRLTEQAEQRLRTIFEATELGAGFRIAMKDLEIRGAGNLLGAEQSGHIASVGFDLYTRMLGEAVDAMRAARDGTDVEALPVTTGVETRPALDLPVDALLPPEYVADEPTRLNLYQRLAAATDGAALGELIAELEDRFGPLPEAAQNLVFLVGLRLAAQQAGVAQISASEHELVVRFRGPTRVDNAALSRDLGVPVRAGSNQVRFPRGRGMAWLATLQRLVDLLPRG